MKVNGQLYYPVSVFPGEITVVPMK